MSLKHGFTSEITDDPSAVAAGAVTPSRWNEDHVIDSAGLDFPSNIATPVAPSSGKLRLFAQEFSGRPLAAMRVSDGSPSLLQSSFARGRPGYWHAVGNSGTISAVGAGILAGSPVTRISSPGNLFSQMRRVGYVTAATANANSTARGAGPQFSLGSPSGIGGFFNVWRFGTSAYVSDARVFLGLGSNNSSYGSTSPNTILNFVGIGFDPGDTVWSIYHNDGVGLATKIPLGAGFPCDTLSIDVIELAMFSPSTATTLFWQVTNLTTGATATGVTTTDLPAANQFLQPHLSVVNGASAVAAGVDFMSMYLETEY